jgi:hypothetical protein
MDQKNSLYQQVMFLRGEAEKRENLIKVLKDTIREEQELAQEDHRIMDDLEAKLAEKALAEEHLVARVAELESCLSDVRAIIDRLIV